MQIQLTINEKSADFFLQYLHSLKEGIVERIVIDDVPQKRFEVGSVDEVRHRIDQAEKRGDYMEHNAFWGSVGVC